MPTFNFRTGKREWKGHKLKLHRDTVIIIEGLHALNPVLLPEELDSKAVFRLYVSALLPVNLDDHNRISTSDSRMIRRMVRDFQFRGRDARKTIETWSEVRQGEEDNIFPFQENADAIFNSATLYELCVLKQYAEPQLFAIDPSMPEYITAKRLIKFLGYFLVANVIGLAVLLLFLQVI